MKASYLTQKKLQMFMIIDKLEARGYGFDPQGKLVDTYADDPYSTFTLGEPVEVFDGTDMTQDYFSGGEVTDSFATSPEDYQALTSSESTVGWCSGTTGTVPMSLVKVL
jgi:hypothetical protein